MPVYTKSVPTPVPVTHNWRFTEDEVIAALIKTVGASHPGLSIDPEKIELDATDEGGGTWIYNMRLTQIEGPESRLVNHRFDPNSLTRLMTIKTVGGSSRTMGGSSMTMGVLVDALSKMDNLRVRFTDDTSPGKSQPYSADPSNAIVFSKAALPIRLTVNAFLTGLKTKLEEGVTLNGEEFVIDGGSVLYVEGDEHDIVYPIVSYVTGAECLTLLTSKD